MAEHTFAPTEERCQNLRRDFFIGYHLRLPEELGPGQIHPAALDRGPHVPQDGQASVEFEVKERERERGRKK